MEAKPLRYHEEKSTSDILIFQVIPKKLLLKVFISFVMPFISLPYDIGQKKRDLGQKILEHHTSVSSRYEERV